MDSLPIELLHLIASHGLLGYKFFTNSLTFNKQLDFKIIFGYSIKITNYLIEWYRNGKLHRDDGPAFEYANGTKEWWQNDERYK